MIQNQIIKPMIHHNDFGHLVHWPSLHIPNREGRPIPNTLRDCIEVNPCFSPIRLCLGVPTYSVQRIGQLASQYSSEPRFLGGFLGARVPWRSGSSEVGFLGGIPGWFLGSVLRLALPCLAFLALPCLPCLALPCLALPCLPCLALPWHRIASHSIA